MGRLAALGRRGAWDNTGRRGPRQHGPTSGVVGGMKRCTAAGGEMNWNDTAPGSAAGGRVRGGSPLPASVSARDNTGRGWDVLAALGRQEVGRAGAGGERGEREREGIGQCGRVAEVLGSGCGLVVYPGVRRRVTQVLGAECRDNTGWHQDMARALGQAEVRGGGFTRRVDGWRRQTQGTGGRSVGRLAALGRQEVGRAGAGGARIWPGCSGGPGAVYRRGGGERGEREREGIGGAGGCSERRAGCAGGGVVYPGVKQRAGPGLAGARRWGALPCRRGPGAGAGAGEGEPVDSGECGGGRLVLGQAGCGPDPMKRPSAGRQGATGRVLVNDARAGRARCAGERVGAG